MISRARAPARTRKKVSIRSGWSIVDPLRVEPVTRPINYDR